MIKRILVAIAGLALILGMTACTSDGTSDPAYRTLRYEGGDTGGSKFKECIDPGEKLASNDTFYSYPTTQRQDKWDSENFGQGANSADYPDMKLTAKGGVDLNMEVTVPFTLNTSCEEVHANGQTYPGGTIQAFHEIFGKTRNGYFDTSTDGNGSYGDGWLWLMDTYLSTCVEQVLTPKARALDPEDAWLKDEVRQGLIDGFKEEIQTCVDNAMETDLQFYIVGEPTVDKITPDSNFVTLYRERQDAETRAETAEFNKNAKIAEAKANAAVAEEEAKIQQAVIDGYGGFDNFAKLKAVESGLNPYQPTYIVSGTKP